MSKYGHPMGDKVIKGVAVCLKTALREADHVARYGGEEFAIILPETRLKDAHIVAERLRKAISNLRFRHNDKHACCTMSFGVVELQLNIPYSILYYSATNLIVSFVPDDNLLLNIGVL